MALLKPFEGLRPPKMFQARGWLRREPRPCYYLYRQMYLDKRWYTLTARPGSFEQTPTGALDASILQENLLGPLLGMGDPPHGPAAPVRGRWAVHGRAGAVGRLR
jgi:hypothetical protein